MSKKNDDIVWIHKKFELDSGSLGYESVESAIDRLQKALTKAKEEGWKDLSLDYDYSYDDSQYLYIYGKRPENEKEKAKRLKDIESAKDRERQQYEALRKKFETK